MKKIILTTLLIMISISVLLAGGLLTNTNQSAHFARNPSRGASTEIDAAYTNPAGLVKLDSGFHFSFTNQSAFQTRTITTTFAPFAGYGGSATKEFKGEASAPIIPSIQGAYKIGKWVLSGNIAVSGGGGKATFNKGLPSFESTVAIVPAVIHQINPAVQGYDLDGHMKGSSFIYGAQLGGSYAINDMFSAYGGFRLNIVNNGYEGYIKDIKLGVNGTMIAAQNVIGSNPALAGFAPLVAAKELDCSQSGWGISPIIGAHFSYKKLNIGVKYEFNTNLNLENNMKVNTTGMAEFDDGVNTAHDLPALFTIGASYQIIPRLTVSAGYHHFFDSNAKMANDKQNYIDGGTNEYLGGAEFQLNKIFLISGGFQITRQGVKDDYQRDLSFALNSYTLGFGGAVKVSPKVRINVGYFWTTYSDWTKEITDYGSINKLTGGAIPATKGTDVFSRTNKVFAAGVDFSF